MKSENVIFSVFANHEAEAHALEEELRDFVFHLYRRGVKVTANRLIYAIRNLKGSPFVEMFFED